MKDKNLVPSTCWCQVFPHCLLRLPFSLTYNIGIFVIPSPPPKNGFVCIYLGLLFIDLCLVSCWFCPLTLRYDLELDMVISPVLFFLLRITLAVWGFFCVCVCSYVNFKVFFFCRWKESCWNSILFAYVLKWDLLYSQDWPGTSRVGIAGLNMKCSCILMRLELKFLLVT